MDGSLDHGFGQDGLIRGMFPNTVGNFIAEILLFDDGRILTVGAYQMFDDAGNYHPSAVIQRFNGNGSLDQSFGNGGFVTIENCWANAATIQMDGRILVAGIKVLNSGNYDFLVARYYEDGSLDTDFDEDGIAITDLGYANINCYGVGVQTDGKILLAGSVYDLNANIALVRYKPDGSLDENFGEYGKVFTDFGKRESIFAMAVDKERIYLSGWQDGFTTPALGQFGLLAAYQSGPICNNSFEVTIPDAYAINPGGNVNTVYVGYQPASSITLTASPSGGNAPDSYNWSTSPSQTTQQITVSPTTTSTYTCTVTDATGCAASSTKTITVVDIRTPGKPGKVNICHRDLKGKWTTLSVLAGSVAEHLTHGDYLGICNNNSSSNEVLTRAANETGNSEIISEEFKIYPNPATHFLDVQWAKTNNSQSTIRILNAEGRVVRTVTTEGAINNQRISLDGLAKGIYMLVLKTGSDQQVSKFVIQ